MRSMFKLLFRLLSGLIFIFLLGFIIVYSIQDRYIFQRQILKQDFQFSHNAEEIKITTLDHISLDALWFKYSGQTKGLILYFHGNRHSLERWGRYAPELVALGYDVLLIDYRGYGKSEGKPTEAGLYLDAEAAYDWAKLNYPKTPLIYYGRSLGTGVATYLASQHLPHKLVLETPFDELKNVVPLYFRFMLHLIPLRHAFRSNERISGIDCPILIMHGTQDQVVPLSSAMGLKPLLKATDQFVVIKGGRHNNLLRFDEAKLALAEFLK